MRAKTFLKNIAFMARFTVAVPALLAGCDDGDDSLPYDAAAGGMDTSATGGAPAGRDATPVDSRAVADAGATDSGAGAGNGGSDGGPTPGAAGYLLAADFKTESIYAYSLPDLSLTGRIDGVVLGNHMGALALPDGRVVASDDKNKQIIAIKVDANGKPSVVNRVDAIVGSQAVWGCADAALTHIAVASQREGNVQTTNIVELATFKNKMVETTLKADEELHSFLAADPRHLFVSVGGEFQAFPLSTLDSMTPAIAATAIPIGLGSHGPVVSHTLNRVYVTTVAGLDGVSFAASPFSRAALIPWNVDGRTTGQNFRPRLSWDDKYVYGALTVATPEGADKWAEREVDFHAADLATGTAKRFSFTKGIVPKFQMSKRHAFFANITGQGDFAVYIGVDAAVPAELWQVSARVPLAALANGPVAGQSTAGKEARASAITPDGRWGFVSHGGEGKISVIDTNTKTVAATITTPSALTRGGYLFAVQPGMIPIDTCTR